LEYLLFELKQNFDILKRQNYFIGVDFLILRLIPQNGQDVLQVNYWFLIRKKYFLPNFGAAFAILMLKRYSNQFVYEKSLNFAFKNGFSVHNNHLNWISQVENSKNCSRKTGVKCGYLSFLCTNIHS
jgi:hypothetical protein